MWKVVLKSGPVPTRARGPVRTRAAGLRRKLQPSRGVADQSAALRGFLHAIGVLADCLYASRSRRTTNSLFGGWHG